jgi:hypothetical protein
VGVSAGGFLGWVLSRCGSDGGCWYDLKVICVVLVVGGRCAVGGVGGCVDEVVWLIGGLSFVWSVL